jgi:AP-3 complex subunit beta
MSGGVYLNSLSENASRLGMRLQETFSEHTRDLALSRGSNSAYFEAADDKTKNIRSQLDSSSDREKMDAMKRLIAVRNVSVHIQNLSCNILDSLYQKVGMYQNISPRS